MKRNKRNVKKLLSIILSLSMMLSSITVQAKNVSNNDTDIQAQEKLEIEVSDEIKTNEQETLPEVETDADDIEEMIDIQSANMASEFTYKELTGSSIAITGYTGNTSVVVIPSNIDGFEVQVISDNSFRGNTIIKSVSIPETCVSIGNSTFYGCTSLETVHFSGATESLGSSAFNGCTSLREIGLPAGMKTVGSYAFNNCMSLAGIVLPDSITSIGSYAFAGCVNLASINYPMSLQRAGSCVYQNDTKLTRIEVPEGVTRLAESAFSQSANLLEVSLPDSLREIGDSAFSGCTGISGIGIPDAMEAIGSYAFSGCTGLTGLELPAGLKTVGSYAFSGCTGLAELELPDSVATIRSYAFNGCTSLTAVNYPKSLKTAGSCIFYGCTKMKSIKVPEGVTELPENVFSGCSAFAGIKLPGTLEAVGDSAFSGCTGLTGIELPAGLKTVGSYAFSGCTGLTGIELPDSVTTVRSYAFNGCTGLAEINYPQSLSRTGSCIYAGCTGLKSIEVPEGVTELPENAFNGANRLRSVSLPGTLETIGDSAFSGCSNLDQIILPGKVRSIGNSVFNGCSGLEEIVLPVAVEAIGSYAFSGCTKLGHIWIGESVTSIHNYSFWNCSVETLTIHGVAGSYVQTWAEEKGYAFSTDLVEIGGDATLKGNVATLSGEGIQDVTVSIYDCRELKIVDTVQTAEDGSWAYGQAKAGRKYRIAYMHMDYDFEPPMQEVVAEEQMALPKVTGKICNTQPETDGKDFLYSVINGSALRITGYKGSDAVIVIPGRIDGYTVQAIGDNAFKGTNVKKVYMAQTLLSIGDSAFDGCTSLETVHFSGATETLGDYAFYECAALKEVNLPAGMKTVGFRAFEGCTGLASIVLPDSVTSIRSYAFAGCTNLASINYPMSLRSAGSHVYENDAKLTRIEVPEGVTRLADSAFGHSASILEVSLPGSLKEIGDNAFSGCTGIAGVDLPAALEKIGDYAFSGCTGFSEISFPNSKKEVGFRAFDGCAGLAGVEMQDGLKTVGAYAFNGCTGLTGVELPDSVSDIGGHAFNGCTGLAAINYPKSLVAAGAGIFSGCTKMKSITVPEGVSALPDNVFSECSVLAGIKLPGTLEAIGDYAFSGCTGLTALELPAGVKTVGFCAFNGCTGLAGLALPDGVTGIGAYAFSGCTGLREVNYPLSLSRTGSCIYAGCTGLKSIEVPEGVTALPENAFNGANRLRSVTLPGTLETVGDYAFNGCSSLVSIMLPEKIKGIGYSVFNDCSSLEVMVLPDAVETIGGNAFSGCTKLGNIWIGENVESIHDYSFWNCSTGILTIHGVSGSYAQTWAGEKGYAFSTDPVACEEDAELRGTVATPSGDGIGNVTVSIYDCKELKVMEKAQTAEDGSWVYSQAREGRKYRIAYMHMNYDFEPSMQEVIAEEQTTLPKVTGKICNTQAETRGENFSYSLINGSAITITGYKGSDAVIVIPSRIDGYTVQAIGDNAFKGTNVKKVYMAQTLLSIGDSAFDGCTSLETVHFSGATETLGDYAFYECAALKEVNLPAGMKTVGFRAFEGCTGLASIVLPDSVTSIRSYAFAGCTNLASINYPMSLRSAGSHVYENDAKLTRIEVPEGVTRLADSAFGHSASILEVSLPGSLKEIGDNAFSGCTGIAGVDLPAALEKIGDYAFSGCTGFSEISFPNSKKEVGFRAFDGCAGLAGVEMQDGLKTVGAYAFNGCTGLTGVELPDSVSDIGGHAFNGCTGLAAINYPKSLVAAGAGIFSGCTKMKSITVPEGVSALPDNVFSECSVLAGIKLPGTLEAIGDYAFSGCTGLTGIELPDSVTTVGNSAFSGCTGLKGLELPDSVTTIQAYAFSGCTGLKEINYPLSLSKTGSHIYAGCTGLKGIEVPEGVTALPENAFNGANKLRSITLPSTLKEIGDSAFSNCISMPALYLNVGLKKIGRNVFSDCDGLVSIIIPNTVQSINTYAFSGCDNLKYVTVDGNALLNLNTHAFQNCRRLQTIYLPLSLTEFGIGIFSGCNKLTIYCPFNSYSTLYAIENDIPFIASDNGFEDSDSLVLNHNTSYYYMDTSSMKYNGYVEMLVEYDIKEAVRSSITNRNVKIRVPSNAVLKESTLKLDGNLCQNYTYEDRTITIPVIGDTGRIEFYVQPSDAEQMMSYAQLTYRQGNVNGKDIIGITNETMKGLTISTDNTTSKKEISVVGVGPKSSRVTLLVNDVECGTAQTSKTGKYTGSLALPNPKDNQMFSVSARCMDSDVLYTADTNVAYTENVPELTDLRLYYNNHSDTGVDLLNSKSTPYISFSPSVPFTFTADFTNKENIGNVYIVSTRNNEKKSLEAHYDSKLDLYVATGYFDETNHSYVPGSISVEMNRKQDKEDVISSNVSIDTSNISSAVQKTTVEKIETGKDNEEKYRFDITDTLADVGKEAEETYVDFTVSMFDDATEMNLSEYVDLLKAIETGTGYFMPDEDGNNWFAKADWKDPETYVVLAKDVSGVSDKVVKFVISTENKWGALDEIAPYLGQAAKGLKTISALQEFKGDYDDLRDEIMMNSNITDKSAALQKAEALYNDQYNYTILMALLPMLVTAVGITGPVAIGFTALCGIIGASSTFFWQARIAQIKGQSLNVRWAIDPSGYVYEGVTANRLKGVTVTAYYKEKLEDVDAVLWDAAEYEQDNPLLTDVEGRYAWDVPEGYWQVKCEKDGYETAYSEWMEVPPPQTDVNIQMFQIASPAAKYVNVYTEYAEIEFNQYIDPDTLEGIRLLNKNGTAIPYSLEYNTEETDEDGKVFVNRVKLIYAGTMITAGEKVSVNIPDTVTATNGRNVEKVSVEQTSKYAALISAAQSVEVASGNKIQVPVLVENYDGSQKISISASGTVFIDVSGIKLDADGMGVLEITGKLPGMVRVELRIEGTSVKHQIDVIVGQKTTEISKQYIVKFTGGDGAKGVAPGNLLAEPGKVIKLPVNTFVKEGYVFAGWSDGSSIYQAGESFTMPSKAVTFKATWKKAQQCTDSTHQWGSWVRVSPATTSQPEKQQRTCKICNKTETRSVGDKLNTVKKGDTFTSNGYNYKITKVASTVSFIGIKGSKKSLVIPATVKYSGKTYKVTEISGTAMRKNKKMETLKIGANVKAIPSQAFSSCTKLNKVTMGSGIKTIGKGAFSGCTKLKSVSMGKNVAKIEASAFSKCKSLSKITIPAKVTSIGSSAFGRCSKLKTVTLKSYKLKKIGKGAFVNIKKGASIKVPKSKYKKYKQMFKKAKACDGKTKIKK